MEGQSEDGARHARHRLHRPRRPPTTLVLAFPGAVDADGVPVTAGSTTILTKTAARAVAPLLHPTGDTFERTFTWGTRPATVTVIEPLPVEVQADAAAHGVLRHTARLLRARPDLDPGRARRGHAGVMVGVLPRQTSVGRPRKSIVLCG